MERQEPGTQLSDHVVICNVNTKVRTIVEEIHLAERHLDVVLLVQDDTLWKSNPEWHPRSKSPEHVSILSGCPTDPKLLADAWISTARAAVILADPNQCQQADARSALVAVAIEKANPQVHTIIELLLSVNLSHLEATDVNEVVCLGEIAEKLVAQSCITPGSSRIFAHLLTTERHTSQVFLEPIGEDRDGKSFREIALSVIESGLPLVVCGFVLGSTRDTEHNRADQTIVLNPRPGANPGRDTTLSSRDSLIVIAPESGLL